MNENQPKHFLQRGIDRRTFLKATVLTAAAAFVAPDIAANAAADWKTFLQTEYLQGQPVTTAIFAEYETTGNERKALESQPSPIYAIVDRDNPLKNSPVQFDRNGQLMKGLNQRSEFVQSGKPDQKVVLKGTSILDIAKNLAAKNEPGSIQLMFVKAERNGKTFSAPVIRILREAKVDFVVDGETVENTIPGGMLIVPNPETKTFSLYVPPTEPVEKTTRYPEITQVDSTLNSLGTKGIELDDGSIRKFIAPVGSLALIERDSQRKITAIITNTEALQLSPQNPVSAPEASATVTPDTTISPIETQDGYHGFETYHDGRRIRLLTNLPPTFANWDKGIFKQMINGFNEKALPGKKINGDIVAYIKTRTGQFNDLMVTSIPSQGIDFAKTKKENGIYVWTVYIDPNYEERFKNHPTKDIMITGLFTIVFPYGMYMSTHNDQMGLSTFQEMRQVIANNHLDTNNLFSVKR